MDLRSDVDLCLEVVATGPAPGRDRHGVPGMRPSLAALAALIALLAAPAPADAEPVSNGDFETGPAIPLANPVYPVPAGNGALTGWSVASGAVSIVTDNYWVPGSGARSIALSGGGPGAIEQSFATTAGASCRLTFWLSGEPFSSPTLKHLLVTAGSASRDYTFDVTPAWHWDMHWQRQSLDFTAASGTTTLRFASLDATAWGPAVDDVRVELLSLGVVPGARLSLAPVAPDPLRGRGRLEFSLASAGPARVTVYDVLGRERARLADGTFAAGPHTLELDGGAWGAGPGLYLAVLEAAGSRLVRRFTVLR